MLGRELDKGDVAVMEVSDGLLNVYCTYPEWNIF